MAKRPPRKTKAPIILLPLLLVSSILCFRKHRLKAFYLKQLFDNTASIFGQSQVCEFRLIDKRCTSRRPEAGPVRKGRERPCAHLMRSISGAVLPSLPYS